MRSADPNDPPKLVAAGKADLAVSYQPQLHLQVNEQRPGNAPNQPEVPHSQSMKRAYDQQRSKLSAPNANFYSPGSH